MMAGMMPPPPGGAGGCAGGDCGSGGAAKTPIYPALMTLPALTPEKRAEIDALATQQINEGLARLAKGAESLNAATQAGDNAAMHQAVGVMRQGLGELDAGIAARRVVSEGTAPRNLALGWFKREMNLSSSLPRAEPRTLLGITPIHLFTMVLLVAFAFAMVAMYFFKMRRAAALFGRIEADKGKPPPGSSAPLAGKPGSPPAGKEPTPAAAPPSKEPPAPAKGPPPSAPASPTGKTNTPAPAPDIAKLESRAGELWQERGRPVGSPEVDWSRAKDELAKATEKPAAPPIDGTPTGAKPPSQASSSAERSPASGPPPAGEAVAASSGTPPGERR